MRIDVIDTPVVVLVDALKSAKPLLVWVNGGLMAVFFLMVGLVLKREFWGGDLAELNKIILPALGVIGDMVVPVLAFCKSGISFHGVGLDHVLHGVPLGIALGLFVGKQVGVFGFCWLGVKLKFTSCQKISPGCPCMA